MWLERMLGILRQNIDDNFAWQSVDDEADDDHEDDGDDDDRTDQKYSDTLVTDATTDNY